MYVPNQEYKKDKHSIRGLVSIIYGGQKGSSKMRGHNPPTYTKAQLGNWIVQQPTFLKLYIGWQDSNYSSKYKPSIDRIDDNKGYTLDNIRLITWGENNKLSPRKKADPNGLSQRETHKLRLAEIPPKPPRIPRGVDQLTLTGELVTAWRSAADAATATCVHRSNILHTCAGRAHTAGGFKWRYTT